MRGLNNATLIGNLRKQQQIQILDGNIKIAKFYLAITVEIYKEGTKSR
jgi:hypothetical protein